MDTLGEASSSLELMCCFDLTASPVSLVHPLRSSKRVWSHHTIETKALTCGGLMMAENCFTPNMPRFEMVKVPPVNSDGDSLPSFACSTHTDGQQQHSDAVGRAQTLSQATSNTHTHTPFAAMDTGLTRSKTFAHAHAQSCLCFACRR